MSGIFGLIHLDDQPVQPDTLDAMRDAMAYWGPDGGGVWRDQFAGLGQLMLYNTPESQYERMPLIGADGNLVLVAGARLDNRAALCDILAVPHTERGIIPDGQLILRAYEKWGEECPSHLLGDWAFAAWHPQQRRLSLARDQFGHTALYYYHDARCFAFASCIKALLSLPQVRRHPSDLSIAQRLVLAPVDGASTLHDPIQPLAAAYSLSVTPSHINKRQYWRLNDAPDVRLSSDEAYVERFLELYTEAVRCRLRSHLPVGVTLSAGLDSSSMTALAAREAHTRGQALTAFTSVPLYPEAGLAFPNALVDEWPLAHLTATWVEHMEHVPIRAEAVTPTAALKRSLWLHDEPEYAASNFYWIIAMLEASRQRGLGVLLTAQLGNGGVSWSGDTIRVFRLLQQGKWRKGLQTLAEWKKIEQCSWTSAVKSQLASPLSVWFNAQRLRLASASAEPWFEYSPIHPVFAQRLNLVSRMRRTGIDPTFGRLSEARSQRMALLAVTAAMGGAFWNEAGAGYGLEVRDPTGDIRLLEFCLGVPEEQWARAGHTRWLVRRAMEGLLPPQVQWNTRRGMQAADVVSRLLAEREDVDTVLAHLADSDTVRRVLDVDRMQQIWSNAQHGVNRVTYRQVSTVLLRGLLTGLFLLTLNERFDTLTNK